MGGSFNRFLLHFQLDFFKSESGVREPKTETLNPRASRGGGGGGEGRGRGGGGGGEGMTSC